jgi:hypothetical protein
MSFADLAKEFGGAVQKSPARSTSKLVDGLLAWLQHSRPHDPPRSPGFHVSGMYDYCPREAVLAHQLAKETPVVVLDADEEVLTPYQILTFMIGHAYHHVLQNMLLGPANMLKGRWRRVNGDEEQVGFMPKDGQWTYVEPGLRVPVPGVEDTPRWNLVGHSDGIVLLGALLDLPPEDEGLVEFKSCNPDIYAGLDIAYASIHKVEDWYTAAGGWNKAWADKYARGHSAQLRTYLGTLGYQQGVVLYIPKGKPKPGEPEVKEFPIEADDRIIEAAFEKIRATYEAWNGGDWAGPLPRRVCQGAACPRAMSCPVAAECFAP